jgi:uncharacterized protein DUF397
VEGFLAGKPRRRMPMFYESSSCESKVEFAKSSYCGGDVSCVEVAVTPDVVSVRDAAGNVASFNDGEWRAFILGVKNGEFDLG